ncbi:hypothetical protein ACA910_009624 [Epithemia clementina (nom. ined.)]
MMNLSSSLILSAFFFNTIGQAAAKLVIPTGNGLCATTSLFSNSSIFDSEAEITDFGELRDELPMFFEPQGTKAGIFGGVAIFLNSNKDDAVIELGFLSFYEDNDDTVFQGSFVFSSIPPYAGNNALQFPIIGGSGSLGCATGVITNPPPFFADGKFFLDVIICGKPCNAN